MNLNVMMALASSTTSVDVQADTDLVESVPTAHVDVDSSQFEKLPMSSVASGLNEVIAHSAPGIVEDSNGFIHPQGDHAQTQFVFDNQPITDQQSKQFSTSMPENAIASVEVITGAPPAEYGDKTSLVINAITKSGLGIDKSFGSFTSSYGSFGTTSENLTTGTAARNGANFSRPIRCAPGAISIRRNFPRCTMSATTRRSSTASIFSRTRTTPCT